MPGQVMTPAVRCSYEDILVVFSSKHVEGPTEQQLQEHFMTKKAANTGLNGALH